MIQILRRFSFQITSRHIQSGDGIARKNLRIIPSVGTSFPQTASSGKHRKPDAWRPILKVGGNSFESNWNRAADRRSGPSGHPQGDPPHHAHPGGRPVADYIGAVAEILRWNAGSGKTGRVESYILTKSIPSTVDIREGRKGTKSEENRPHWQERRPISVSLYSAGCGKMRLISRGGTYHGR